MPNKMATKTLTITAIKMVSPTLNSKNWLKAVDTPPPTPPAMPATKFFLVVIIEL